MTDKDGFDDVYVSGSSVGIGTNYDYAPLAYDATTGSRVWVKRYNDTYNADDGAGANAVALSPDGSKVFVTGWSATLAYDAATGTTLWVVTKGFGGQSLAASPDGSKM